MSSFYSYLSLLEGLQFAVLILVLQRYVPSRWRRYAVFVALLPILFNTPLGLNSNGMRKLAPVLIILLVTARARSLRVVTGASVLLGLQLAYSHEYGLACLAALIGMYGVMAARREGWYAVLSATILTVGSIATWFTATHLLMGDAFSAYLERSLQLFRYFSQGGSAFRFYWTLNSLALFGLLAIACVWVGSGLFAQRRRLLNPGDRLTLAGLLFALVALKGGLNRSDLWHLNAAFLALTRAFLLSSPTRGFAFPWGSQKIALSLIGIVSVTYLVGIAPTGSFYAAGYVRGLVDVLVLSKPTARESAESRVPTVQLERTDPDPNILGLGEYLAEDTRSDRPVFFYNELWLLPIGVGACREDSTLDNFMHGEDRQLARNYLQQNPDTLVIMGREAFERLYGLADPVRFPEFEVYNPKTLTKSIGSWTSSVHFHGLEVENRVLDRLWKRKVGDYIRPRYDLDAEFGPLVALTRSDLR